MRRAALLGIVCATLCTGHNSEAATPSSRPARIGEPYEVVRARLIARGYEPVQVLVDALGGECKGDGLLCKIVPEVVFCSNRGYCEFLFRSRHDGNYWIVGTSREPDLKGRGAKFESFGRARYVDLDGVVVEAPHGRRHRFLK